MVEESQQLNKMLQEKYAQKEFFQQEVERIETEKDASKLQIAKMKKAIDESCMPEVCLLFALILRWSQFIRMTKAIALEPKSGLFHKACNAISLSILNAGETQVIDCVRQKIHEKQLQKDIASAQKQMTMVW